MYSTKRHDIETVNIDQSVIQYSTTILVYIVGVNALLLAFFTFAFAVVPVVVVVVVVAVLVVGSFVFGPRSHIGPGISVMGNHVLLMVSKCILDIHSLQPCRSWCVKVWQTLTILDPLDQGCRQDS
jgi:hypothetical protein